MRGMGFAQLALGSSEGGELDALLVWLSAMAARIISFEEKYHACRKVSSLNNVPRGNTCYIDGNRQAHLLIYIDRK